MPLPSSVVTAIVNSVINAIVSSSSPAPPPDPYSSMVRNFPAETRKGELSPPVFQRALQIDGRFVQAAPGLQIRNQRNLIVMSGTLQQSFPIRYQLDSRGNVWRVWLLSSAEQAAPDPQPRP